MKEFTQTEITLLNTPPHNLNIEQQFERKRLKQRVDQAKYRSNLTNTTEKKSEFRKEQNTYIQKYRTNKKIELLNFLEKKTDDADDIIIIQNTKKDLEKKLENINIPIVKPPMKLSRVSITDINKNVTPTWLTELIKAYPNYIIGDKNYIKYRAISDNSIKPDINVIISLMKNMYNTKPSIDLKRVLTLLFNGYEIKQDIKFINTELSFLNKENIHSFIEKLEEQYTNINSLNKIVRVLTNITSRIESYDYQYQFLSNICINISKLYIKQKGDNLINEKDKNIFEVIKNRGGWDYLNIELNNNLIQNNDLSFEEQAIASLFLLTPPRRLDHQYLILTDKPETELNDKMFNYLIMKDDVPFKFVYNRYKTESKGGRIKKEILGQQIFNVYDSVIPYLKQHIIKNKIKLNNYLFGSNKYTTPNKSFGKKITIVMLKIYKVDNITSTVIRQVAAIYNQNTPNRSSNTKKGFALEMGHSENTNQLYSKIVDSEDETNDVPDVKTKEEILREKNVLKKNKIPIVKKVEPKIETTAIVDDNIRRSTRNRNRSL